MEAPREVWPPADLRAGDADRKHVVAELQRHYVDGRISSEELSERITTALRSRTFGELRDVLKDLPSVARAESAAGMDKHSRIQVPVEPLGAAMILVGVLALLWMLVAANSGHWGFFPFWPVLFIFFFIGRPFRGGRHRF